MGNFRRLYVRVKNVSAPMSTAAILEMVEVAAAERALLAAVPKGARVLTLPLDLPGCQTTQLASGARVLMQYDVQRSDYLITVDLDYAIGRRSKGGKGG